MPNKVNLTSIPIFLISIIMIVSCQEQGENERQVSSHGEDESHKNYENCMNCHYTEGSGDGWFSLAGTTDGNFKNGFVEFYTGEEGTGQHVTSMEIDQEGNFYTTEHIDFGTGFMSPRARKKENLNLWTT